MKWGLQQFLAAWLAVNEDNLCPQIQQLQYLEACVQALAASL